jgi:MarR family multiple antibiotic resistance transcriptional regulator
MDNPLFDDQDYELWVLLQQARDAVFRAREKELRKCGISTVQSAVLFIIQAIGHGATPAEISRWMFRRPHGVSALLDRMEKEGLVKKVKDLDRKNMVRVEITEKGYQAYDDSTRRESVHRIMSSLSEEQRRQLKSWLLKVRDTACEELRVDARPHYPSSQ